MKKKILISIFFIFSFIACFAMTMDVSGVWTGNLMNTDSTAYPVNYSFIVNGNQITGTAQAAVGTFPIDSGTIDSANNIKFQVTVNGVNILHSGIFYGDSIGMNISLNGATTHCTLIRNNN